MTAINQAAYTSIHFNALFARIILHSKYHIFTCPIPPEHSASTLKLMLWHQDTLLEGSVDWKN